MAPQSILPSPKAQIVFLPSLIQGSSDIDPKTTLLLKDPMVAALTRDRLARQLGLVSDPQVLVLGSGGSRLHSLGPARIGPPTRPAHSRRGVWNDPLHHQHYRPRGQ